MFGAVTAVPGGVGTGVPGGSPAAAASAARAARRRSASTSATSRTCPPGPACIGIACVPGGGAPVAVTGWLGTTGWMVVFGPTATPEKNKDAVERTLFNPTRRPAPVAVAEAVKPKMQRGQFTLAGTIVVEGKTTALLKEVSGGKPRRVLQGESINGMTVVQVAADRVTLKMGDESEDLMLKVAVGPKTTIQPVVPNTPITATANPAGTPAIPTQTGPGGQVRDVADVLAERRRAARAAEAAAAGLPPGTPVPTPPGTAVTAPNMPPVPQGDANSGDPRWQETFRRYQQPRAR